MKVVSPAGIEHVFNDANYVVRNAYGYADLYSDTAKSKWIAQVPNDWMIIAGKCDAVSNHNITPEKAATYIKENFYRIESSWIKRDLIRFFHKISPRTLKPKK